MEKIALIPGVCLYEESLLFIKIYLPNKFNLIITKILDRKRNSLNIVNSAASNKFQEHYYFNITIGILKLENAFRNEGL